jgi:hypothetical protein
MTECRHCGQAVDEHAVLCAVCGGISAGAPEREMLCENHTGEPAVACCVMCGKPVCGDCATSRENVFLCDLPEHHQAAATWVRLVTVGNSFEADMIRTNLTQGGIGVRVSDPGDFAGSLGIRKPIPVSILVQRATLDAAAGLLRSFQFMDTE